VLDGATSESDYSKCQWQKLVAKIDVVSEVTGTVWRIIAAAGQLLNEDDELMVIESMKMEIPLGMPEDGAVEEILVAESDSVSGGQVVARITVC
jgi:acetyl-CoA carboxylase biotin carboxyl carrier protein